MQQREKYLGTIPFVCYRNELHCSQLKFTILGNFILQSFTAESRQSTQFLTFFCIQHSKHLSHAIAYRIAFVKQLLVKKGYLTVSTWTNICSLDNITEFYVHLYWRQTSSLRCFEFQVACFLIWQLLAQQVLRLSLRLSTMLTSLWTLCMKTFDYLHWSRNTMRPITKR